MTRDEWESMSSDDMHVIIGTQLSAETIVLHFLRYLNEDLAKEVLTALAIDYDLVDE